MGWLSAILRGGKSQIGRLERMVAESAPEARMLDEFNFPDFGGLPPTQSGFARPLPDAATVARSEPKRRQLVTTSWGAKLSAQPGQDYIVSSGPKDRWVVRKDIFDNTYEQAGDQWRKRSDLTLPYYVSPDQRVIDTLEGPVTAHPGDYVMRGSVDEQWPVRPQSFAKKYQEAEPISQQVMHGSAAPLNNIRPYLFATDARPVAQYFAKLDKNMTHGIERITPIDYTPRNPLIIHGQGHHITVAANRNHTLPQVLASAQANGHDAVIYKNVVDGMGDPRMADPVDVHILIDPRGAQRGKPDYYRSGDLLQRLLALTGNRQVLGLGGAAASGGLLSAAARQRYATQ